jgi:hypothetical protein
MFQVERVEIHLPSPSLSSFAKSLSIRVTCERLSFESESQLREIDDSCFRDCSIGRMCISDSLERIGRRVCRWFNIRTMKFGSNSRLREIGDFCFNTTSFEEIGFRRANEDIGPTRDELCRLTNALETLPRGNFDCLF